MIQGGAFRRSYHRSSQQQPALHESLVSTASTLISLSLAQVAWLKASGKKAWSRQIFANKIFNKTFANISLAVHNLHPSFANNLSQHNHQ